MTYQIIYLPLKQTICKRRDIKGDRPNYRGTNRFGLPYGNGCKLGGESCFECKLPDCEWTGTQIAGTNGNYQGRKTKGG